MTDSDSALSPSEQRFVDEYLVTLNASAAYRATHPGCAHSTARAQGCRLLHTPRIAAEIAAGRKAMATRTRVTADLVVEEIARIAFSDVLDLYNPDTGLLLHPRHIPFDVRKTIEAIKVRRVRKSVTRNGKTKTTVTESIVDIRLADKVEALDRLTRHLGLADRVAPLDALLNALPAETAAAVRVELGGLVGATPPATGTAPAPPGGTDQRYRNTRHRIKRRP